MLLNYTGLGLAQKGHFEEMSKMHLVHMSIKISPGDLQYLILVEKRILQFKIGFNALLDRALSLLCLECAENPWSKRKHLKHETGTVIALHTKVYMGVHVGPTGGTQELRMI